MFINKNAKFSSLLLSLSVLVLSSCSSSALLVESENANEQSIHHHYEDDGRVLIAANHSRILDHDHELYTIDGGAVDQASGGGDNNFERMLTVYAQNYGGGTGVGVGGSQEPVFDVGYPRYGGTGCPGGSVAVASDWKSDSGTISFLFDDYYTVTDDSRRGTRSRKSCNMALPIKVRPGISVGVFKVDYRGWAYVPPGLQNYALFDAEYFFAGTQGPKQKRIFGRDNAYLSKYYDENWEATDEIGAIVWTGCNSVNDFNFRINTSLSARKKRGYLEDDTEIGMESADLVKQGMHYHVKFRYC